MTLVRQEGQKNKEQHNMSEKKVETNCLSYQEKKNLIGFAKTLCATENISNWKLLKKKTDQTKQVKLTDEENSASFMFSFHWTELRNAWAFQTSFESIATVFISKEDKIFQFISTGYPYPLKISLKIK